MKRTTVLLPDDLAYLLDRERRRRGVSTAAVVREALAAYFNVSDQPRRLRIVGIGHSGLSDIGSNFDYYLDQAWGSDEFYEETMGHPPPKPSGREDAVQDDDDAADVGALRTGAAAKLSAAVTGESEQIV